MHFIINAQAGMFNERWKLYVLLHICMILVYKDAHWWSIKDGIGFFSFLFSQHITILYQDCAFGHEVNDCEALFLRYAFNYLIMSNAFDFIIKLYPRLRNKRVIIIKIIKRFLIFSIFFSLHKPTIESLPIVHGVLNLNLKFHLMIGTPFLISWKRFWIKFLFVFGTSLSTTQLYTCLFFVFLVLLFCETSPCSGYIII